MPTKIVSECVHTVWLVDTKVGHPREVKCRLVTTKSGRTFAEHPTTDARRTVGVTAFLTEEAARRRLVGRMEKLAMDSWSKAFLPAQVARAEAYLQDKPRVYRKN